MKFNKLFSFIIISFVLYVSIGFISFAQDTSENPVYFEEHDFESNQTIIKEILIPELENTDEDQQSEPLVPPIDSNGIMPLDILGYYDSIEVNLNTKAPYKYIGKLHSTYSNGRTYTSEAYMIDQHRIVTCAHSVYKRDLGYPTKIEFVPGAKNKEEPYGRFKVRKSWFPNEYKTYTISNKYDYAVCVLEKYVNNGGDGIAVASAPINNPTGKNLLSGMNICGYRDNKLFKQTGDVWFFEQHELSYVLYTYMDAKKGYSGAPIYYKNVDNKFFSIGIITSGDDHLNYGRRFTMTQLIEFASFVL